MSDVDLSLKVAKLVEEMRNAGTWPGDDVLTRLAAEIGSTFGAKREEVAILRLSSEGMLSFLYPLKLAKLGSIPVTSSRSLAVKNIREKRCDVINNFSVYKHPTVFESVDLSAEEKATPIQKIISAPMISEGKVAGVIQVSRKGRAGDPIGPDFTPRDAAELSTVGSILAKYLATLPATQKGPAQPAKS